MTFASGNSDISLFTTCKLCRFLRDLRDPPSVADLNLLLLVEPPRRLGGTIGGKHSDGCKVAKCGLRRISTHAFAYSETKYSLWKNSLIWSHHPISTLLGMFDMQQ